jgi:predicted lipid-binding transport protein (Tim44 family)
MSEAYDPAQHLLTVAIIVFYWQLLKLWSQPPPPDQHDKSDGKKATTWPVTTFSGVVAPLRPTARSTAAHPASNQPPPAPRAHGLAAIRAADAAFDETTFLAGASLVYERVVSAYGAEDLAAVDALLDPRVASDFAGAISTRRKLGERRVFTFVGLRNAEIVGASTERGVGEVVVRFTGDAASATWAADGSLLRGDPGQVVEMTDVWTFSRRLAARSPNWTVVATEGE